MNSGDAPPLRVAALCLGSKVCGQAAFGLGL